MPAVTIRRASYDAGTLRPLVFAMLDSLGGARLGPGSRVLIKPNLLAPATPRRAILTHPAVIRCAVEYVLEKGARPLVADSPAIGRFDILMRVSGIREALRGLDCECRPFRASVRVDVGEPFGFIDLAEDAVQADAIVNLAKFKTHSQMLLTLAVKNLFGCVVGYRKPEWHMRAGVDRGMFAQLIVRIGRTLKPAFNLVDGILALEGEGPGRGGVPRPLGILLAGEDPFAVDLAACRIIGLDPLRLPVLEAAERLGVPAAEPAIDGEPVAIRDFRLPRLTPIVFGPAFLQGFLRRQVIRRPVCDATACRMCGECWKICPARAIAAERQPLSFDYDRCIRCYCCIEVCPFGALRTAETLAGRVVRRIAEAILTPGAAPKRSALRELR
jgi:uncharacterized protein (DUF362 family)/Pyruvate/2-oxoacid:ferredoxin oxidoreductase delta subunit